MAGTLSIVGTPIGNLEDITIRALRTLRKADTIACEDTRHTMKLLARYAIRKPLVSCYGQNERQSAERIIRVLEEGRDVAYVSDAGTPGLSDPGSVLVRMVREQGFPVVPIPGPSAFATLLSVGGFPGRTVTFEGFLSPKPGRRKNRLAELLEREEAFLVYESPFRVLKILADLADLDPQRRIVIGREMTKMHEELMEGTAGDLRDTLAERSKVQGEFALLVSGRKND